MALALPVDILYTQNTTPGATFASGSWTPAANKLYFIETFHGITASTAGIPTTLTGNGITWTKLVQSNGIDASSKRMEVWAGYSGASPTAGAVTLTLPASENFCIFAGVRQDGPTGTDRIIQSAVTNISNVATITGTLAAFASSTNSTIVFGAAKGQATGASPGSGFTEIRDSGIDNTRRVYIAAKASSDVAPSFTMTGDPDGVYTGQGLILAAVEVSDTALGWTVDMEVIVDVAPTVVDSEVVARIYIAQDGVLIPINAGVAS